jgi:hypothetical protein
MHAVSVKMGDSRQPAGPFEPILSLGYNERSLTPSD